MMAKLHHYFVSFFIAGSILSCSIAHGQEAVQKEQIAGILKAHPEIVLNILKNHGDELLTIIQEASDERRKQALLRQWDKDAVVAKSIATANRPCSGLSSAPVTIVEYTDFSCVYCRKVGITVAQILRENPEKVRLVVKLAGKTPSSNLAAEWFNAAYRLDATKSWVFYNLLFSKQTQLEEEGVDLLRKTAAQAGFDITLLEKKLLAEKNAITAMMKEDAEEAERLGFSGTPYFLVNNLVVRGAIPKSHFEAAMEKALTLTKK